jgi:sulfur relay (sulfurtransferase) DsrC/TusE family protein
MMNILRFINNWTIDIDRQRMLSNYIFAGIPLLILANILFFIDKGVKMNTNEIILVAVVIIVVVIFISWFVSTVIIELLKMMVERELYNTLKQGFLNNNINTKEDVDLIAYSNKNLTNQQVRQVMLNLYKNTASNKENKLQESIKIIKTILSKYEESESFSNIPTTIKHTIKTIQQKIGKDNNEINYLIMNIQDIFIQEKRKVKAQYFYTLGGFLFGVLGVAVAIYQII